MHNNFGASKFMQSIKNHLFLDETLPSFFRRLSWSPDGSFLLVPAGTTLKLKVLIMSLCILIILSTPVRMFSCSLLHLHPSNWKRKKEKDEENHPQRQKEKESSIKTSCVLCLKTYFFVLAVTWQWCQFSHPVKYHFLLCFQTVSFFIEGVLRYFSTFRISQ